MFGGSSSSYVFNPNCPSNLTSLPAPLLFFFSPGDISRISLGPVVCLLPKDVFKSKGCPK